MPDLSELLTYTDDQLRRAITPLLEPGPYRHDMGLLTGHCRRCGQLVPIGQELKEVGYGVELVEMKNETLCPVPPPASGSWAEMERQLLKQVARTVGTGQPNVESAEAAIQIYLERIVTKAMPIMARHYRHTWLPITWYAFGATPRERVIVLVGALQAPKP